MHRHDSRQVRRYHARPQYPLGRALAWPLPRRLPCGARLPASVRDRWFDAIEALGIDPLTEDVPANFNDETWLRDLDVS